MPPSARVQAIYRYPVKGLTPEWLRRTALQPGKTLTADRRYAIENGPSGFDPAAPAYLPKIRFLMLMRNARLARLTTVYDDATTLLTIRAGDDEVARGALATDEGRRRIEAFFATFCADELRGPPQLLEAPGHSFSDVARKVVSIINLGSVAAIETAIGAPVDPLRFRANMYVQGWPAGASSASSGRPSRSGAPPACGSSSALCVARRPRSIRTPESATSPSRAHWPRPSGTWIAASMAR
jgi:hypothetical protein